LLFVIHRRYCAAHQLTSAEEKIIDFEKYNFFKKFDFMTIQPLCFLHKKGGKFILQFILAIDLINGRVALII